MIEIDSIMLSHHLLQDRLENVTSVRHIVVLSLFLPFPRRKKEKLVQKVTLNDLYILLHYSCQSDTFQTIKFVIIATKWFKRFKH